MVVSSQYGKLAARFHWKPLLVTHFCC